jgi:hypothetical protein
MGGAGFCFGGYPDRDLVLRLEVRRVVIQREDLVGIFMTRFNAVIRPLEGLNRVLAGGKGLTLGRVRFGLFEGLRSAQPDGVFFGVVGALERESAEPRTLPWRKVKAEEDDVGAGDCVSTQAVMVVEWYAHGNPSSEGKDGESVLWSTG